MSNLQWASYPHLLQLNTYLIPKILLAHHYFRVLMMNDHYCIVSVLWLHKAMLISSKCFYMLPPDNMINLLLITTQWEKNLAMILSQWQLLLCLCLVPNILKITCSFLHQIFPILFHIIIKRTWYPHYCSINNPVGSSSQGYWHSQKIWLVLDC